MGDKEREQPQVFRLLLGGLTAEHRTERKKEIRRSNEVVRDVVEKRFISTITREQVEEYMEVTNAASAKMRGTPRRGRLGTTKGEGLEFRWQIVPIDRIEEDSSGITITSDYTSGLKVADLMRLQGETLHTRIQNLEVYEQEVLMWIADVLSQERERELLQENMSSTSAFLNEQLGVEGIQLTEDHTRLLVLRNIGIVFMATNIVENSITAIRRIPGDTDPRTPDGYRASRGDM